VKPCCTVPPSPRQVQERRTASPLSELSVRICNPLSRASQITRAVEPLSHVSPPAQIGIWPASCTRCEPQAHEPPCPPGLARLLQLSRAACAQICEQVGSAPMIPHQTHPHPPLTRTSGYVNMLPPRCSRQRDSLHPHSQPDRIEHVTLPAIIIKRTRHRPMYPDPDLTGRRSETSHHHHASTMRRDGTSSYATASPPLRPQRPSPPTSGCN